jgi:DNA-binding NarL/FixJ family response regulator
MDVEMPHINGIEATLLLRKEFPDVKVVALSGHAEKYYVQRMLEAGARAYVLKMGAHEDLVSAIRAADLGHTYLSSDIAGWVVERGGEGEGRDEALGAREREVLQLVAGGRTSAQIAKQLHISIKTVETHRRNIARRLRLHGTAELTKYAIREGLSSLESSTQQPQRPQA